MLLLFLLVAPAFSVIVDESKIKEFKWRGPPVIDETIFTNPESFDYDFTDDLKKQADLEDIYDQNLGVLPRFNVYKLGKDEGYTKVPIVTRRWQTWSTPANTRGPLDFFATPSTPVSPVFVTTDAPITTKRMTTSTEIPTTTTTASTTTASTTTERTTVLTTTRRPRTTTTRRTTTTPATTTTQSTTAAGTTTTSERFFFHRERIVHQPRPVFQSGRGPIWRKGGRIEFEETATTTSSQTLATTPATIVPSTTASFFRRRPFGIIPGIRREQSLGNALISLVRTMGSRPRNSFRSRTTTTPQPTTTTAVSTTTRTTTPRPTRTTQAPVAFRQLTTTRNFVHHAAPKPIIIHHGATKYRGPTYNCRVLNPFEDGKASPEHDNSCQMLYPGMSSDGNCRCFYKVSQRDEHGCAMGFLYACRPLNRTSVVV